ncbi:MAG: hypothetical protein ABFS34_11800 [Gemmatimonadota bacterium]
MSILVRVLLAALGMAVIFIGVVTSDDPQTQLALVIIGVILIQGGVWTLAHRILGPRRRYHALRAEVGDFLGLVRDLNQAAVSAGASEETDPREAILREMQARLERMVAVAGKPT